MLNDGKNDPKIKYDAKKEKKTCWRNATEQYTINDYVEEKLGMN